MSLYYSPPASEIGGITVTPRPGGYRIQTGTSGAFWLENGSAPKARELAAALLEAADLDDARSAESAREARQALTTLTARLSGTGQEAGAA